MARKRATSGEWLAYYTRADRAREIGGDPFQRLVERSARRGRLFRVGAVVVALAAAAAICVLVIWLFENVSLQSIVDPPTGR